MVVSEGVVVTTSTLDGGTTAVPETFPCQVQVFKVKAAWKLNQGFQSETTAELKDGDYLFIDSRHIFLFLVVIILKGLRIGKNVQMCLCGVRASVKEGEYGPTV